MTAAVRLISIETADEEFEVEDHGFTVNVAEKDGKWWATWLQCGVGAAGGDRAAALRALADLLADHLPAADAWAKSAPSPSPQMELFGEAS